MEQLNRKRRSLRAGAVFGASVVWISALVIPVLTGCMDCNQRFCKVTRKVGFDIYWIRLLCCEDPGRRYCDDIVPLIPQMTNLIIDMQISCEEANWQRMRSIWAEIKGLGIPAPFVKYYKGLYCEEEVDTGCNSHPFFAPMDIFRFPGLFAAVGKPAPIVVMPGAIESPWLELEDGRRSLGEAPEVLWETEYILDSGSMLIADTWLGSQEFAATGSLAIARAGNSMDEFCREARPTRMRIDLLGADLQGCIELDVTAPANALRLDSNGRGVLSGLVDVQIFLREDPSISLEGMFEQAWMALPVLVDEDDIVVLPDGVINGLSLFPVAPEIEELLHEISSGSFLAGEGLSECQELARDALEIFRQAFPECYPANAD